MICGIVDETVSGFTVEFTAVPLASTPVLRHLYTLKSSVIT